MPPIFSSTHTSGEGEILDFESVRAFVARVNHYIVKFLEDSDTRNSVRQRCTSKLKIQRQEFFEFSEHSVLSNLYWGIESIEAAIQVKWPEEKISRLKSSERMLQVPALVQEHGVTGGIENQYLVCCSYFYLSLCRKLQKDDWQVTLHFLHAMLVNPRLVREEFMPELWESIFLPQIMSNWQESEVRDLQSKSLVDIFYNSYDEATTQLARRCKDLLMYYQVMLYGETTQDEDSENLLYRTSTSSENLDSVEHGNDWPKFKNGEKIHPIDVEDNMTEDIEERAHTSITTRQQKSVPSQEGGKDLERFGGVSKSDSKEIFGVKSLQDMLKDSQSDTSVSVNSCNDSPEGSPMKEYSAKKNDSEIVMDKREGSVRISTIEAESSLLKFCSRKLQNTSSMSNPECTSPEATYSMMQNEGHNVYTSYFFSSRFLDCISDLNIPPSEERDIDSETFCSRHVDMSNLRGPEKKGFRIFDHISSKSMNNYGFTHKDRLGTSALLEVACTSNRGVSRSIQHTPLSASLMIIEVLVTAFDFTTNSMHLAKISSPPVLTRLLNAG